MKSLFRTPDRSSSENNARRTQENDYHLDIWAKHQNEVPIGTNIDLGLDAPEDLDLLVTVLLKKNPEERRHVTLTDGTKHTLKTTNDLAELFKTIVASIESAL